MDFVNLIYSRYTHRKKMLKSREAKPRSEYVFDGKQLLRRIEKGLVRSRTARSRREIRTDRNRVPLFSRRLIRSGFNFQPSSSLYPQKEYNYPQKGRKLALNILVLVPRSIVS